MIDIVVIDHRAGEDHQRPGKIINTWTVNDRDPPGMRYADFCALWCRACLTPSDIIGFFGYRKYLCPIYANFAPDWLQPAHAPNWYHCGKADFDDYRDFMAEWDGSDIKRLLAQCDILQAAPYPLETSMFKDFAESRSMYDAGILNRRLPWKFMSRKIYPYLFITRWSVFDRMMREIEPIRLELDPLIRADDSLNEEYKKRPMAYVMERVYSLWLEHSGLEIKEIPLLHCWEMQT